MRILLATYPEKPIFQPMVPLAWALRTAGHEVRVASQPFFADTITQAGLTAVPVGRQTTDNWRRLTDAYPDRAAAERVGLPAPYDVAEPGTEIGWDATVAGYRNVLEVWHKQNNFPMVAGLVEFARSWQPDLVVWEATTYAGAIAAKACGAAHARLLWSVDIFGIARDRYRRLRADAYPDRAAADPLGEWLGGYGRRYGFAFTEDMITGHFTVDQLPPALRMEADLHYLPMRYVPYGGAAVVPRWLTTPPERPRVAITLGTSATEWFDGYTFSVQDTLDALSDLDIEVVATIAESEQHKLTRVPANTRIVPYVPLDALAPTCSVIVNHAGPGTLLTTARHGVPQLNIPWEFDEPVLARLAEEQGAALTIHPQRVTGKAVRDHVLQLLTEPAFTEHAGRLRAEMHALPTPNELVGQLEELTTKHRTAAC